MTRSAGSNHMEVHGPTSVGATVPINHTRPAAEVEQAVPAKVSSPQDEVDISAVGKMMENASRTPGVREERLAQIKAAIEAGNYDTPEKLELALSRMVEQVLREETK